MQTDADRYIGNRIREYRERENWTQDELAAKMQIRGHASILQPTQARIETGFRVLTPGELISYARVFGIAITTLLGVPDLARDAD